MDALSSSSVLAENGRAPLFLPAGAACGISRGSWGLWGLCTGGLALLCQSGDLMGDTKWAHTGWKRLVKHISAKPVSTPGSAERELGKGIS